MANLSFYKINFLVSNQNENILTHFLMNNKYCFSEISVWVHIYLVFFRKLLVKNSRFLKKNI